MTQRSGGASGPGVPVAPTSRSEAPGPDPLTPGPPGSGRPVRSAAALGRRHLPEATLARLSGYLRVLRGPDQLGSVISSDVLARLAGVNPALLRKDLSLLGSHGVRGVGYDPAELADDIGFALGEHRDTRVAVVGVGHLGRALAGYRGFAELGLRIAALFDVSPQVIGQHVDGVTVRDVAAMTEVCADLSIGVGIVATPAEQAQAAVDALVTAGVSAVLNFAPALVSVPAAVVVRRVDLALELQLLAVRSPTGAVVGMEGDDRESSS